MSRILPRFSMAEGKVMPFRKTPWQITVKCLRGFICVAYCKMTGILIIGVIAPERRMQGTPIVKAPRNACCWVEDNEETMRPSAPVALEKTTIAT